MNILIFDVLLFSFLKNKETKTNCTHLVFIAN